jgi:hypothetical protein
VLTEDNIALGQETTRGPHWSRDDQDGGAGALGVVIAYKKSDGGVTSSENTVLKVGR